MRLNIKAMALTFGLLWGAAILLVGLANLAWPDYGTDFLDMIASLYPGFDATDNSVGQSIIAMLYGLLDGLLGGAVVAWLYNRLARSQGVV